jgi:RHS repeat-associated protein
LTMQERSATTLSSRALAATLAVLQALPAAGLLPTAVHAQQSQSTQFEYDAQGNLTKVTDPNGQVTVLQPDTLNRTIQVTQPEPVSGRSKPIVKFTYDGLNRLTRVVDANGGTNPIIFAGLGDTTTALSGRSRVDTLLDASGNIVYRINQRNQSASITGVDALNRPTTIEYSDDGSDSSSYTGLSFLVYDQYSTTAGAENYGRGKLTAVTNYKLNADHTIQSTLDKVWLRYDQLGRVTRLCQFWPGVSAGSLSNCTDGDALRLSWNNSGSALGRLGSQTYPSGRVVSYQYDGNGRIQGITTTDPGSSSARAVVSSVTYTVLDPAGGAAVLAGLSFGDGQATPVQTLQRHYDTSGRIQDLTIGQGALGLGSTQAQYTYTLDDAGRIKVISGHDGSGNTQAVNYGYDNLDRLNSATLPGGVLYTYDYDANGNRTLSTTGAIQTTLAYPSKTSMLQSVQVGTDVSQKKSITTDVTGNITGDPLATVGGVTYTYTDIGMSSPHGRLTTSQGPGAQWDYTYNYFGQRIRKKGSSYTPSGGSAISPAAYVGSTDTLFYYDLDGHLIAEADGSAGTSATLKPVKREYIWLGDTLVAVIAGSTPTAAISATNTAAIYYVHSDHLDTPRLVTDATGKRRWSWDLMGAEPFGVTAPNEAPAGQTGASVFTLNMRFPGQYLDKETGSFYNYFRNYNPSTGRYLQSDPIGLKGGLNTYGYVSGNPLSLVDPMGLAGGPGGGNHAPQTPDEPADTSPCAYYQKRAQETGCRYYKDTAPFMCAYGGYVPLFWGVKNRELNCIRRCLAREDTKLASNQCTDSSSCRSDNEIDAYHKVCYAECGVNWSRYPGVNPLIAAPNSNANPNKQK